jgi:hypothetical protein
MATRKLKFDKIPSTKESKCQTQNMKQNRRNQLKKQKNTQLLNLLHNLTTTRIRSGLGFGNEDVACVVDLRSQ